MYVSLQPDRPTGTDKRRTKQRHTPLLPGESWRSVPRATSHTSGYSGPGTEGIEFVNLIYNLFIVFASPWGGRIGAAYISPVPNRTHPFVHALDSKLISKRWSGTSLLQARYQGLTVQLYEHTNTPQEAQPSSTLWRLALDLLFCFVCILCRSATIDRIVCELVAYAKLISCYQICSKIEVHFYA